MASSGGNQPHQHDETSDPGSSKQFQFQRVFPIRVQTIHESPDPKENPGTPLGRNRPVQGAVHASSHILREEESVPSEAAAPFSDHDRGPLVAVPGVKPAEEPGFVRSADGHIITERFSLSPQDGEVNTSGSETGRRNYRCEDEPIHIPGAIQQFGALVAVKEYEDQLFSVRIASENSQMVVGHTPKALFELRSLTDLLPNHDKEEFIARVRSLWDRPEESQSKTRLDIFAISLTSLMGAPNPVWCALHLIREVGLIVCEFELQSDIANPTQPPDGGLPEKPVHIADSPISSEERLLSTSIRSKPLHSLRFARERGIQLGPMPMFDTLHEIQSQLAAATSLPCLLEVLVGLVAELTSFHRATVYHFEDNKSGFIMSEFVDERASRDFYRGLHFPASDIPKQARELYMVNTIRILYDRQQETARLVCRGLDDALKPLDLTHSYLRAMSPVHLKYLANMGVRASMSISLPVNGKLWGLVSCHGYGTARRVIPPLRELCRSIGECAGAHIERLLNSSRLQAQKAISSAAVGKSRSRYIAASLDEILSILGADFGLLVINNEARSIGKLQAYNEAIALLQYVRTQPFSSIVASQDVARDFPDLSYTPGFSTIAGLLFIPLALANADFILLFRVGQLQEVNWAGNPYEKTWLANTSYLEPRASFRRWTEHVMGKSREWTDDEVESATVLRDVYGRFIEIWRQKEVAMEREQMMRLLIRNASHEAHPPLNNLLAYLESALGQAVDNEARERLEQSLEASSSLVFIIGDLLTLTNVKESDPTICNEDFSMRTVLTDVTKLLEADATERQVDIRVDREGLSDSHLVRGNASQLMQVVSHLAAILIQNATESTIILGSRRVKGLASGALIEIYIEDTSVDLSEQALDEIFHCLEQARDEDQDSDDEDSSSDDVAMSGVDLHTSLELGLVAVAQYLRLNHGEMKIASEEGKGTRLSLKLLFQEVIHDADAARAAPDSDRSLSPAGDVNNPNLRKRKFGELGA